LYGAGKERIGFCRPEDLDLVCDFQKDNTNSEMARLLSSAFFNRPRDFWEIKNELSVDSRDCAQAIWCEVWQGRLTSDSFEPVRRGIEFGFIPENIDIPQISVRPFGRQPRIPGALRNRWRDGAPVHGNWFSLVMEEQQDDPIEEDAINRDRVRLLLSRWGLLCRPLLEREAPQFSWSKLLPTIRRMELAGELTAGRFFSVINSLQFASPSIASELERAQDFNGIYWMNAADPSSPAGVEIEGLEYSLCARNVNNRLYYRGAELIAISVKNGKEIQIFTEAGGEDTNQIIGLLKIPRTRKVMPESKIAIEKINGQTAAQSSYASCFINQGFLSDRGKLILW
jgi:ATP-dependent Lhr-like helicase